MQPNEANIKSMAQTAKSTATTQGSKPQGPLGVAVEATPGLNTPNQKNATQLTAASNLATNAAKGGPATSAGSYGVTTGQASNTGLISGQMMSRRI
jgi:hypothetical protein